MDVHAFVRACQVVYVVVTPPPLQDVDSLDMDGTFYSRPPLWGQLYVIHGFVGGKVIQIVPLVESSTM